MAKKKKYLPVEKLEETVYQWFKNHPQQPTQTKQLAQYVHLDPKDQGAFGGVIDRLLGNGIIIRSKARQYKLSPALSGAPIGEGKIMMSRSGFAFVTVEGQPEDIFIAQGKLHGAMHGDKVKLSLTPSKGKKRDMEGEVISIIERSIRPYIGILQLVDNRYNYVITDSRFMPYDISVNPKELNGAKNGEKVAVLVTGWNEARREPIGKITHVLGQPGDNNTEMHAILTEFGLPFQFSKEVEDDAAKISNKITAKDIAERRDFRGVTTCTIDPTDAKDFDDALSIQQLENGNWEIGVHIADVTHYVQPDSLVEKEAVERATSVYLVDRTVPMLPERLSNELCSLRPNEDKLCFSVVFELNNSAKIINRWVGRTIIRSVHRFDYDGAQDIIETKKGPYAAEVLTLHKLAQKLRQQRLKNGALNFDTPEPKVQVDDTGKPLGVYFKEMKEANFLIEEFMLLANCGVAEMIGAVKDPKTFVYRIHDEPTIDRLNVFRDFIKHFGYKMGATKTKRDVAKEINKVIKAAEDKPELHTIEIMALRTMARAVYSTDNIGHYGLAFDYYSHFTSPIRRYPDMMVHRLLAMYLAGAPSQDKAFYQELCKHSSQREQLATEAERASIKYKMVEFMQDKEGQEFDGTISGVTESGIYVEINENGIEGYIPQREMKGDMFMFISERFMYKGKRKGKTLSFGDPIRIKVQRARLDQKLLDFAMVD